MAKGFDDARKADQANRERDIRLFFRGLRDGRSTDFDAIDELFRKLEESRGVSKKGAQASARLKVLEMKKMLDAKGVDDSAFQEFIASILAK